MACPTKKWWQSWNRYCSSHPGCQVVLVHMAPMTSAAIVSMAYTCGSTPTDSGKNSLTMKSPL